MPTPIATSVRFFQVGVIEYVYYTVAVNPVAPTFAEIQSGTRLSNEVESFAGWTSSSAFIETKDALSRVSVKVVGRKVLEDSSLTFNGSSGAVDAGTFFAEGASGYMLVANKGLVAGKKADIYSVTIGSVAPIPNVDSDIYKVRVDFGMTGAPTVGYALPAGTYT